MSGDLVIIIDDQDRVRLILETLLEGERFTVRSYASAEEFLADIPKAARACLLVDVQMPGMNGLELQQELLRRNVAMPLIFMSGQANVAMTVKAIKAGAFNVLEKPVDDDTLIGNIRRALASRETQPGKDGAMPSLLDALTDREIDVLKRLILGESNKAAAAHLMISPRTVEIHRAHIQTKLKATGLSDLIQIARKAGLEPD